MLQRAVGLFSKSRTASLLLKGFASRAVVYAARNTLHVPFPSFVQNEVVAAHIKEFGSARSFMSPTVRVGCRPSFRRLQKVAILWVCY